MNTYSAVVHTDGILTLRDIVEDCREKRWVPLLVLRDKQQNSPPQVTLFTGQDTARQFSRRNLPKKWMHGEFTLNDGDLARFTELGWEYKLYNFPFRVRTDRYEIGLEVYDVSHYGNLNVEVVDRHIHKVVVGGGPFEYKN